MSTLPLLRLLKIRAAISYLELIRKIRKIYLHFLFVILMALLVCIGIVFVTLAFFVDACANMFGWGMMFITGPAAILWFLLSQKTWMRIFEADTLIESIRREKREA